MLVTAPEPAHRLRQGCLTSPRRAKEGTSSTREAAIAFAYVTAGKFDQWVVPENIGRS